WWSGADIAERQSLGLSSAEGVTAERAGREAEKQELSETLRQAGLLDETPEPTAPLSPTFAKAVHAYLAQAPSALVFAQADDLAGERSAVNLPGTDQERPNWRRRLGPDIEELFAGDMARPILETLRRLRGAKA